MTNGYGALHDAAAENEKHKVLELIAERGTSYARQRDELGGTALHVAAFHASYEAAQNILKRIPDIAEVSHP